MRDLMFGFRHNEKNTGEQFEKITRQLTIKHCGMEVPSGTGCPWKTQPWLLVKSERAGRSFDRKLPPAAISESPVVSLLATYRVVGYASRALELLFPRQPQ